VIVAFAGFITDIVPDDETTRGGNGR
jgi:hypothetical protein